MSNSIMQSSESVSDLLGQSSRAGSLLSELLKNKAEPQEDHHKQTKKHPSANALSDVFAPSQALQQANFSEKAQSSYAYSNTMTMSLTTQEGDKVSVDFRQLYSEYKAYEKQQGYESGSKGARFFESTQKMESTAFKERFGFSVQGDLNNDELKAIFNVFGQVDDLANHFFHGNIEKAFQKAVDLNVDFGQLQSVSVNLQQTQSYAASYQQAEAYQQQSSASSGQVQPSHGDSVAALPPYLQKMQSVIETLDSRFKDARVQAEKMLASIVSSRFPQEGTESIIMKRLQQLHNALINKVGLDAVTLKPSGVIIDPSASTSSESAPSTSMAADKTSEKLTE